MKKFLVCLLLSISVLVNGQITIDSLQGAYVIKSKTKEFGFATERDPSKQWMDFMVYELRDSTVLIKPFPGITISVLDDELECNYKPHADAGNDTTVAGQYFLLKGKGWDRDGFITKFYWNQTSTSPVAYMPNPGSQNTTVTLWVPGRYEFELTLFDDRNSVSHDRIVVTRK